MPMFPDKELLAMEAALTPTEVSVEADSGYLPASVPTKTLCLKIGSALIQCDKGASAVDIERRDYANYGGRGITVCERWLTFENFLADMGEPPLGHSLDRIDNDGNYQPGNCRWVVATQQNRNKRSNRLITIDGISKSLADWCEQLGLNYWTVHARLRRGATPEEALC